jgi:hypothetical protein
MAIEGWIDPSSHWKVTGHVDASGRMSGGTVTDQYGTDRSRNESFASLEDFTAWVKKR